MILINIYPNENESCEVTIEKDGIEIKLTTEECKELWKKLSLAESFDFKLPF